MSAPQEPGTPAPSAPASTPLPATPPVEDLTPTGKPGSLTTLTGVPTEGVEAGCLLLDGYLLLGGPRDVLTSGRTVSVTGRVEPGLMTTCQQGTPLLVESATYV